MTFPIVIIGGADQELFDALAAESANAFAPSGARIMLPTKDGLSVNHAQALIEEARKVAVKLPEVQPINVIVLALAAADRSDEKFREKFFPFSFYAKISAPDYADAASKAKRNRIKNIFVSNLKREAISARHKADIVKGKVSVANMTPLILPMRNFRRNELKEMLTNIYNSGTEDNVASVVDRAVRQFLSAVPYTKPPGSDRRCFSDGRHFFKSPGRHRHGYYHNSQDKDHEQTCLLNARARLGGALAHDFHFDCEAVQRLDAFYPDCHNEPRAPKPTYINIAPSDAVI